MSPTDPSIVAVSLSVLALTDSLWAAAGAMAGCWIFGNIFIHRM